MHSEAPKPTDIETIAEEAYLYGLQQVIYYGQRYL